MVKKNIVTLFMSAFLASSFLLFWEQLSILYQNPLKILDLQFSSLIPVLYIGGTLIFLLPFVSLLITLDFPIKKNLIIYSISSFTSILFFKISILIVVVSLAICLSLLYFDLVSRRDLKNQIKLKPTQTFSKTYSFFITAIALIISFGYYPFASEQVRDFRLNIPDRVFNEIFTLIPGFDSTSPLAQSLESQFEERLDSLVDLYRPYLPAIFAVTLFATLRILSTPISFFSLIFMNISLWFLKFFKVIKIEKVQKECEILSWG